MRAVYGGAGPDYAPKGRKSRRDAESEARELPARFGLADKGQEYPDLLSGGRQRRAAIARAPATEPELLLLDEITSALDPELVGEMLEVVGDLKRRGFTIVMATHEMDFARHAADQVCFLEDGAVRERGTPEQIFTEPRSPPPAASWPGSSNADAPPRPSRTSRAVTRPPDVTTAV